jgi:hypothetical protein
MHSFGEMFQALNFLLGRREVPAETRPLTSIREDLTPRNDPELLRQIDVTLIELGATVDIHFRNAIINRARVEQLLRSVSSLSKQHFKLCQKWMRVGLIGMHEETRRTLGAEIEALDPGDKYADLRRAVLREARAQDSDIAGSFKKLRDMLGCPIGAVIFVFRYMPDGRPVIWPAGTREEVTAAASAQRIPVFEPMAIVKEFGVDRALEKDGRHYTREFLPVIGGDIVRFAQDTHARSALPEGVSDRN